LTVATIAVTGASGFIGRRFVSFLESRGHRVAPLHRHDMGPGLASTLGNAEAVVHLAGRAHVLRETAVDSAKAFHEANVGLTEAVLGASIRAGVRRFVLMSSAGVLGNVTADGGVDDDSPPAPYDHYSRSKLAAEEAVKAGAAGRIETVILRPPMVYGPGARGNFERILRAVERGWPLPVGRLRAPRSMIGLRNLCDLTLRASLDPAAAGATLLASDDQTASVRDLAVALGVALGKPTAILDVPVPVLSFALRTLGKGADIPRLTAPFVVHARRARELLGWTPPHGFAEEIGWTVAQTRAGGRS
jgi:nucleoside-diphosphate-sugar epimerase